MRIATVEDRVGDFSIAPSYKYSIGWILVVGNVFPLGRLLTFVYVSNSRTERTSGYRRFAARTSNQQWDTPYTCNLKLAPQDA